MVKGLWARNGVLAVPMDDRSREFLLSIREGMPFIAETHGARNPRQLALWWLLCQLLAEQMEMTKEKVSDDLKIALGHADTYVSLDESVYVKPRSINFESMPQDEFNNLFRSAVAVISRWLMVLPKEVMEQFDAMIGDKRYQGLRR